MDYRNCIKKLEKKHLIAILIALVFILMSVKIAQSKKIKKQINTAQTLFLQGKYDESIETYKKLAHKKKKNPLWYCKIGRIYYISGEEKKAKEYMDKAKNMDYTKYEEAFSNIIFNEFLQGEYKKALEYGEKAVKLYPKNKDIIKQTVALYIIEGKEQKGKELLKSYPLNKKSSEDLSEYGKICINIGNEKEGLEKLKEAYKLDKDNIIIYDTLSQMASLDMEGTVKKINSIKKSGEDQQMYKTWLSKVYSIDAAKCEEALKLLRGDKIDKESLSYNILKLSIYSNLGDFHNGDKVADKLQKDYKDDYRMYHSLGWYYLKKGKVDKAKEYCLKSIDKNPSYVDNYGYLMPEIISNEKNNELSSAYYSEAMYREPFNYNIMMNAGNYCWNVQKNMEKSMKYYKLADSLNRNNGEIKYNIALMYLDNNKDQGMEILNKCIELNPKENKYYRSLSVAYFNKGKYKEVIKLLEKAYANDKNDFLTLNNMAVYYIIGLENIEKGFEYIDKAYTGAKKNTDYHKYTLDIMDKNYKKIKELHNKYKNTVSPLIEIPELTLFY